MKIRLTIAVALAVGLTACGGQDKPAAEKSSDASTATSTVTSTAASTATSTAMSESATTGPAAPMKGAKPSREFVVGKWGTDGDCQMAIELRADGTSDGPFGNWTYNDGVISFVDEPDFKVNVTVIDDATMESTNESSGKAHQMTRCP